LTKASWRTVAAVASLILLWLLIFLPTLGKLPLIRSEAMYAQIPLEMLQSGDWLIPRLNGARYLDKPPLLYWINLTAFQLGGVSEDTVRLATFIIGLGEVLATLVLGALLFSRLTGWLGALILLTSIGFFALHVQMLTDHLITLTLAWSMVFFWLWRRQPRTLYLAGFYGCLALGLMSKGLIGLFFPLAVGLLFALLTRDTRFWRFFLNPWGWVGFAAMVIPWFGLVELNNPGFLQYHFINEQISRFFGQRVPPDIKSFSLVGYWLFTLVWLMPWTPFLPAGLVSLRPQRWWPPAPEDAPGLLLVLWAGVILLFFSFSSSRIEYYSLPALPPLALIIGRRLELYLAQPESRAMRFSLVLYALLILGLNSLVPFLEQTCADNRREFIGMFDQLQPLVYQAAPILAGLSAALALACWRRRPRLSICYLSGIALTLLYFTFQSLWLLSPHLSDDWAGEILREHAQPHDIVVMGNIEEFEYGMSLRYYAQRRVFMVQRHGLPAFGFPLTAQENYLINPQILQEFWQSPQRVFVLLDECAPEDYLQNAITLHSKGGKRLIAKQAFFTANPLHLPETPLLLEKDHCPPKKGNLLNFPLCPKEERARVRGESGTHDTVTR
jgi:4-amino-4-deoxy-L-arabinose transferase-like glycosyltransferase